MTNIKNVPNDQPDMFFFFLPPPPGRKDKGRGRVRLDHWHSNEPPAVPSDDLKKVREPGSHETWENTWDFTRKSGDLTNKDGTLPIKHGDWNNKNILVF